jgi:putative ABC transport system permease protein
MLRGLATRKLRSALTAIAILLGVAMIAGTFILTDQIRGAFDDIFLKANQGTDVVLSHQTAFDSFEQAAGPIPASILPEVEKVPGVAKAAGQIMATGSLVVDGKYVESQGGPSIVISTVPEPFNQNEVLEGTLPQQNGTIAVDKGLADREDLKLGDKVQLATKAGLKTVTISGVFKFAASDIGGTTIIETTLDDAQRWFDRVGRYSVIGLSAETGVTPDELARRVKDVVPSDVKVQTGLQNAEDQASDAEDFTSFLRIALLVFAFVAVLVGAFVIFNTFSITVAQRTRELALVRTLGASRRQVRRAVVVEALIIGVIASILGLVAGLGFAKLLNVIFDAVGFGLPTAPLEVKGRTIAWALGVGIVVTFLAALIPAFRATRVPPIAALREGAELPPGRFARLRPILSGLLGVIGILLLINGLFGSGSAQNVAFSMAIGAVLVFIGVATVARYVVPGITRAIGWPLERTFGGSARLARENAVRNPARTASTSAALMIGVGLMVFVTVFLQGLQTSFTDALGRTVQGDLIVQGRNFNNIPLGAAKVAATADGVAEAVPAAFTEVKIGNGGTDTINGVDPGPAARIFDFDWREGGDNQLLADLGPGEALIEKNFADSHDLKPGDTFTVTSIDGKTATLRVTGVYRDPQLFTGFTVSNQQYARLISDPDAGVIVVKGEPGVDPQTLKASVSAALEKTYPVAEVKTKAEYEAGVEDQVSIFRNLLYGLLLLPVIISLFGIVNTLVLSIFERTREIGMLRAIGLTRQQLRSMIRFESVITAVIGGVLGIAIGLLFGWLMVKSLEDEGITFDVPVLQLILLLVLAIAAGLIAATFPARRAARLNVLQALQYE